MANAKRYDMGVGKYFDSLHAAVECVDFHKKGQYCITSSKHFLTLYDACAGKERRVVKCCATGTHLARYTHHNQAVLFTGRDGQIHYLSLHDDKYLHHFKGHRQRINSLSMHPTEDQFLSSSPDMPIALWDLRARNIQSMMEPANKRIMSGKVCTTYNSDPNGVIIAASLPDKTIRLCDPRSNAGAFKTIEHEDLRPKNPHDTIEDLSFSNDGKKLLVSYTNSLVVVDGYSGDKLTEIPRPRGARLASCFTPDSETLCIGLSDGAIQFWNIKDVETTRAAELLCTYKYHDNPVYAMQWNPRYFSMVSCGHRTAFWIPKPSKHTAKHKSKHAGA